MITGLDRCQNRSATTAIVFQDNERFVVHLAIASHKIPHYRVHSSRRFSEEKLEQVDKMDAIGESHARVPPRAFEAAKIRAQHFNFTEAAVCDRIAHPDRCWIEPKN